MMIALSRMIIYVQRFHLEGFEGILPSKFSPRRIKMKAVHQRIHIVSFMMHKFKLPCVRLARCCPMMHVEYLFVDNR